MSAFNGNGAGNARGHMNADGRVRPGNGAQHGPRTSRRKPRVNALALVTAIAGDVHWDDGIKLNTFAQKVLVRTDFPPNESPIPGYRELDEVYDILAATLVFQAGDFPGATKHTVKDALLATAKRSAFHPVADYLASLRWDGHPRIHLLAEHYFKARMANADEAERELSEDERRDREQRYLRATSRAWMVAAVARVLSPGAKVDCLPVLVGPEAFGKSEAIRELCPHPDWFSEDLSTELGERDTKEALVGKWIIELSEIPHVRREADRVKAFFSRRVDRFRRAYGTANADHPRQNVFIGSSNDLEFVSVTGNRRFWPWDVTAPIDPRAIAADRDQLWAEAAHEYNQGTQWWLTRDDERIAADIQASFVDGDEFWFGQCDQWLKARQHPGRSEAPFTLETLFLGALGYEAPSNGLPLQIDKRDQARAGTVLKALGYRRRRQRLNGVRAYWWVRRA